VITNILIKDNLIPLNHSFNPESYKSGHNLRVHFCD